MFETLLFSKFFGEKCDAFHIFLECRPQKALQAGRSLCIFKLDHTALDIISSLDPNFFSQGLKIIINDNSDGSPGSILDMLLKQLAYIYCKYFFLPLSSATIPDLYKVRQQKEVSIPPIILHRNITSIRNFPLHLSCPLTDSLAKYVPPTPVIIVLPGPSLSYSKFFLHRASRHCLIICVAKTLKFCLSIGVTPDFIVNLDTDLRIAGLLNEATLPHSWLISLSNGNISSVSAYFRGVFFMDSFNSEVLRNKYRMRESWLSVSICCLGLAEALRAPQIIMVGSDGCWLKNSGTDDRYYNIKDTHKNKVIQCLSPYTKFLTLPCSGPGTTAEGESFAVCTVSNVEAKTSFLYYAIIGELEYISRQFKSKGVKCWQWGGQGILNPTSFTPLLEDAPKTLESWPLIDRNVLEKSLVMAHQTPLHIDIIALENYLLTLGKVAESCLVTFIMQYQQNTDIKDHPLAVSMHILAKQKRFPRLPALQAIERAGIGSCIEWLRLQRKAVAFMRLYQCCKRGRPLRLLYREDNIKIIIEALSKAWPMLKVNPIRLSIYTIDTISINSVELYSGILYDEMPVLLTAAVLSKANEVISLVGEESWLSVEEVLRFGKNPIYTLSILNK